jgi:hypothetical protein
MGFFEVKYSFGACFMVSFFESYLMDRMLSGHYANYRVSVAARDKVGYGSGFQRRAIAEMSQKYLNRYCKITFVHLHHGMELTPMTVIHIFPIILEWNRWRRGMPKMEAGLVGR